MEAGNLGDNVFFAVVAGIPAWRGAGHPARRENHSCKIRVSLGKSHENDFSSVSRKSGLRQKSSPSENMGAGGAKLPTRTCFLSRNLREKVHTEARRGGTEVTTTPPQEPHTFISTTYAVSPLTLSPLRGEGIALGHHDYFLGTWRSYDGGQGTARLTQFG